MCIERHIRNKILWCGLIFFFLFNNLIEKDMAAVNTNKVIFQAWNTVVAGKCLNGDTAFFKAVKTHNLYPERSFWNNL